MIESQKKVLVVEDDIQISKVYEIKLAKEGILTVHANNGEDAMKLLSEEKPDLIILDLMIPKKDGFWVLSEIKENNKYLGIPVLVISNLGQKDDMVRAMDLGATEYLIKVDHQIQEIVDKIKEYFKN